MMSFSTFQRISSCRSMSDYLNKRYMYVPDAIRRSAATVGSGHAQAGPWHCCKVFCVLAVTAKTCLKHV